LHCVFKNKCCVTLTYVNASSVVESKKKKKKIFQKHLAKKKKKDFGQKLKWEKQFRIEGVRGGLGFI
jgi:hypothetical protein